MRFTISGIMIWLTVLIISGCQLNNQRQKPLVTMDIISGDSMAMILTDIQIAESAIKRKQNRGQNDTEYTNWYYHGIFEKYHIDKTRFDSSLWFYHGNPQLNNKIMQQVINNLQLMQAQELKKGSQ